MPLAKAEKWKHLTRRKLETTIIVGCLCNLPAHYDLNRNTDHLSCYFSNVSPRVSQVWHYLFNPRFPTSVSQTPADPSETDWLTALGWWVGRLRAYLWCKGGEVNAYFVNTAIASTGVFAPESASAWLQLFGSTHLWLLLRWIHAPRSMAVGGVSEQVNGLLTPHHWLAWLIRQWSTPRFPSLSLSPQLTSSLFLPDGINAKLRAGENQR